MSLRSRSRTDSVVGVSAGEGVTTIRNRESAFGGVKPRLRAIVPSRPMLYRTRNGFRQPLLHRFP